jgi:hypothetical protein
VWRSAALDGACYPSKQKRGDLTGTRRLPFWELPTPPPADRKTSSQVDAYSTYIRTGDCVGTSGMKRVSDWTDEETEDPHYAERRNFYKVESGAATGYEL